MMNNDGRVDALYERVQSRKGTVERLIRQINAAADDDLVKIRGAYVAQLAKAWSDFSSTYPGPAATLEMLQHQADALTEFVDRFDDIAQQPRLSSIAQDLNRWLKTWHGDSMEWQAYLRTAANEQLEEIETRLASLVDPPLGDEEIEDLARRWLKYQVNRLRDTEKQAHHVVDWLDLVGQNLFDARNVVDELLAPIVAMAPDQENHALVAQICLRWGEQQRQRIAATSVEVENLGLDACLDEGKEGWRTIQLVLPNLGAVLATCSEAEMTIAQNQIDSWQCVSQSEIDELLHAIADVRSIEEWHTENRAFLDADTGDEAFTTSKMQELNSRRPQMPISDDHSSFGEFQKAMNKYKEQAERWLTQCQDLFHTMLKELETWQNSMWPSEVLQELPQFDDDRDILSSFAQLAIMSSQLHRTEERANEFAEESLGPAERTVWRQLQGFRQDGRQMVNLPELATEESLEGMVEAIVALANRNLIKVIIEL